MGPFLRITNANIGYELDISERMAQYKFVVKCIPNKLL